MGIFEDIVSAQDSEKYLSAPLEKKIEVNQAMANLFRRSPEYFSMDFGGQDNITKKILSRMPGYDPATITGDDVESNRSRELLLQAEAIKTGQSDLNGWDGIWEGGRNFLSGKITAGLTDIFVEGDLTEAIYGDINQELERYRDYVAEVNNPEGMADYKVGKVFGNIIGFGTDAVGMTLLYGSVGAPGLIGRGLGMTAGSKIFASAMTKGGKALAMLPLVGRQAAIEGLGYVAETAIADYVIGQLDTNEELDEFIKNVPGTFAKGLVYFGVGEIIGAGLGGALKGVGRVFTGKGWRDQTINQLMNQNTESVTKSLIEVLSGSTLSDANVTAMRSAKVDESIIKQIRESDLLAKLTTDPIALAADPNELRKVAFKLMYGMDIEYTDTMIKISSFDNEAIKPVFIDSSAGLREFFQGQTRKVVNTNWETSRKFEADRIGKIKLEAETVTGKKFDMDIDEVMKDFRIHDFVESGERALATVGGISQNDPKVFQEMAEKMLGKETPFKIQVIDDYFTTTRTLKKDVIGIPRIVETPQQLREFTNDFFNQIAKASEGRVKFNSQAAQGFVQTASNVKYDKKFLTDRIAPDRLNFLPDGGVEIRHPQTQQVIPFDNVKKAGAMIHSDLIPPKQLGEIVYAKKGGKMKMMDDGSVEIKYTGKDPVTDTYASIGDVYLDPKTRPDLPYSERANFIWLNEGAGKVDSIGTGTITQLRGEAKKFEKTDAFVHNVFRTKTGKIAENPLFQTFRASYEDTNFSKEFDSLEKAKAWLGKDTKKYADLKEDLVEKGWLLEPAPGGGYKLQTPGKDPIFAKDLRAVEINQAAYENIYDIPDQLDPLQLIKNAPDDRVIGQASEVIKKNLSKALKIQQKFKGLAGFRAINLMDRLLVPIRERLERTGERLAVDMFDRAHVANRIFHSKYAESKKVLDSLFHGKGRDFSLKELTAMGDVLQVEVSPAGWKAAAEEAGIELTPAMTETMETVRKAMDILGAKFQIPANDWIKDYWPKLAKMKEADFTEMLTRKRSGIGDEWFKHLRTEDYISTQFDNNIETIMELYLRTGYRNLYLGDVVDEMNSTLLKANKKGGETISKEALILLEDTQEKLIGRVYSSDKARAQTLNILQNQAHARAALDKKGDFFKWSPEKRAEKAREALEVDWNRYMNDLSTASLMAFKMKMPLRNVSQVYTILGVMSGPDTVFQAQRQLGNDEFAFRLYKELYDKGIVKAREGRAFNNAEVWNKIKNWNQIGLNNFYNSDDYTRMVSSLSARDTFRNSWELVRSGEKDLDYLMKACKTDYLNPSDRVKFAEFIQNKQLVDAETFLQRRWTDITMFDYDQMNKPELMNSGLGKIFGQFSTYPFSYAQFVKRGIAAEGPIFLTKLGISTAGVAAMYNDVLGIDHTVSYNPMQTMFFAGGPILMSGMGAIQDTARLVRDPSVSGVKAIGKNLSRVFVPYYGIGKGVLRSISEFNEADVHAGTINLLGGTVKEDSLFR